MKKVFLTLTILLLVCMVFSSCDLLFGPVEYTVTFNSTGGSYVPSQQVKEGKPITAPLNPTRENFTFGGWYMEHELNTPWDPAMVVMKDLTLYAKWVQSGFTITYVLDSSINAPGNPGSYTTTTPTIVLADATRTGYTFDGWYTDAGFTTPITSIPQGSTGDLTIYAKLTANSYDVIFHKNALSATGTMPDQECVYGTPDALDKNLFTYSGYSFLGWATSPNGIKVLDDEELYTIGSGDTNLYAKWDPNQYTLTYDKNDPSAAGSMSAHVFTYDSPQDLHLNTFTLDDHHFTGWSLTTDGDVDHTDGEFFSINPSDMTLYAVWELDTYDVTFERNGVYVKGIMNPQTFEIGVAENLKALSYTNTGHNFDGWAATADGTVIYADQASYTIGASDDTLYAIWSPIIYTITYHLDGGTHGENHPDTYTYVTDTFFINDASKDGVDFGGWYTDSAFTEGNHIIGVYKGSTGHLDLYAKWSPTTYEVTFDKNSSTAAGTMPNQEFTYGTAENLDANAFTNDGHTFDGWATSSDGASEYADNASYSIGTSDVRLYAHWTIIDYDITYDLDGGTNDALNPAAYQVTTDTITFADPTKAGHTFGGWYSDSGFTPGNEVTQIVKGTTGNASLYAKWTINGYDISFDKNHVSASGTMANQTITYDVSDNLSANGFTNTGYTFVGWATTPEGTVEYADGASYTMGDGNVTLYAVWTPIIYTITYHLGDGETNHGSNPATYTIETTTINLEDPTKDGHGLDEWYTDSGCTSDPVETIPQGSTGDIDLYPKWLTAYGITYELNGGTNHADNLSFYTSKDLVYTLLAPTREGFDFLGWYESADFSGSQITTIPDGSTTAKTYYAKWETPKSEFDTVMLNPGEISITDYTGTQTNIIIPEKFDSQPVVEIGSSVFSGRGSLVEVVIPDTVTLIGSRAFQSTGITSIDLPSGLETIGDFAFIGCSELTSVVLPDSLTYLGEMAFKGSSKLAAANIPSSLPSLKDETFNGAGLETLHIPSNITTIPPNCFASCDNLTTVTFDEGVTLIDNYAFQYCYRLSSVTLPDSVITLDIGCFNNCTSLDSIEITENVSRIEYSAFWGSGLTSIFIPDNVDYVGSRVFYTTTIENIYCEKPWVEGIYGWSIGFNDDPEGGDIPTTWGYTP